MGKNKKLILNYILYLVLSGLAIYVIGIGINFFFDVYGLFEYKDMYEHRIFLILNPMIVAVVISFFFIRQKKKLIETNISLQHGDEKYKEILDFLPVFVYETDKFGNITHANEFARRELGYSDKLDEGKLNFADIIQPQDMERAAKNLYKNLLGRLENTPREYILLKKDGTKLKCLLRSKVLYDDKGVTIGTRGVALDITDRSILEQKYFDKSKFLNDVIDMLPIPLEYRRADGKYIMANKAYYDFFGLDESIIGKLDKDVFKYNDNRIEDYRNEVLESEKKIIHDNIMVTMPDRPNENKFIELFSTVYRNINGQARGIIDVFVDTTPVKILKSNLEKAHKDKLLSESNFEILSQNSMVGIVLCDGKQIEFANEYFKKIFGIIDVEIEGADLRRFVIPEYMQTYQTYRDNLHTYDSGKCIVGMDIHGERKLIVIETKITMNENSKSYMTYVLDITNYTNKLNYEKTSKITEL